MKEELEAAVALVQQYLPPSPDMMQVVMNAGTASISQAGPGRASLKFPGYVKANDALTLTFDTAVKSLQQIDVKTWLDEPDNAVTLKVTMARCRTGRAIPAAWCSGCRSGRSKSASRSRTTRSLHSSYNWKESRLRRHSAVHASCPIMTIVRVAFGPDPRAGRRWTRRGTRF